MNKVGICGVYGEGENLLNGQTIKTKMITAELIKEYGSANVKKVDTYKWRRNPLKLIKNCYELIANSENVIILPAQNGIKVFPLLFVTLNFLFKRKIHYIVIGGWLPDFLKVNPRLKKILFKFNKIYVETESMVSSLKKLNLDNTIYLPNFKRLEIIKKDSLIYSNKEPLKLCTFSRVSKEKGIEEAVMAVKNANEKLDRNAYTLDIFGQIDENYKTSFKEIEKQFPAYISYKGLINESRSVETLKEYFLLLFPTYYEGEGFAGTILDSFASGLPVIASNWKYNSEIIKHGRDGLIHEYQNTQELTDILISLSQNPEIIYDMKLNCIVRAEEFSPENVMKRLIKYL